MPAIAWDASLESGITEFDDHHRHLIDLLNTLYDDFSAGAPDEHMGSILHELAQYASYHFSAEESLDAQPVLPGPEPAPRGT